MFPFLNYWLKIFNYDLKFLITGVITQIFVVAAELAIPTDTPIKKGKSEIEIHPVTTEAKIRKCSI